jgi:hypothetical protein
MFKSVLDVSWPHVGRAHPELLLLLLLLCVLRVWLRVWVLLMLGRRLVLV